jgi:hypothetical protein
VTACFFDFIPNTAPIIKLINSVIIAISRYKKCGTIVPGAQPIVRVMNGGPCMNKVIVGILPFIISNKSVFNAMKETDAAINNTLFGDFIFTNTSRRLEANAAYTAYL